MSRRFGRNQRRRAREEIAAQAGGECHLEALREVRMSHPATFWPLAMVIMEMNHANGAIEPRQFAEAGI